MRITITAQRRLNGEEGRNITRNVQLVLSRFEGLVSAVNVIVEDLHEGGVQLRLQLSDGRSIMASERNPDPTSAARQAAQRAASVLDRSRSSLRAPRMARIAGTRFGD